MTTVVGTLGPAGLRGAAAALAGRRLSVGTDAGSGSGAGFAGGGGVAGTVAGTCGTEAEGVGGAGVAGADTGVTSCSDTRLANGTRAYGPGAAGFLNIGFGRGRVGDGEPDGVTTDVAGADVETAGRTGTGGRVVVVVVVVGNLMRTLRDSLGSAGRAAAVDSTLTGCSSPSLSSSMISVGSGRGRTRGRGRGTTTGGVVGVGVGVGTGTGAWFGTCTGGVASFGGGAGAGVGVGGAGGVGVDCSGARGAAGAVSSRVR